MLEFSDLSPTDLLAELRRSRHDYDVLLLGGGELNTAFLEAGLVDRILITIEPVLFAGGTGLLAAGSADIRCNLLSVTQLNERGTLLVDYAVDKS
jgi:riboflavin biosynthesis pyrimidine reductase